MVRTVLAYLGYKGNQADDRVLENIELLRQEIEAIGEPKSVMGVWECAINGDCVSFGGLHVNSPSLAKHMAGAKYIGAVAVTLGVQADMTIHRYSVTDMSKSVIADAVASVIINEFCGRVCNGLFGKPLLVGLNPTSRYSPGYGDFSLSYQQALLDLLNAGKRIGLSTTDGQMLVPGKSVTALVGYVEA